MKVCDSVLSYFDRNGSYVSTRRIADQCGRNIIAQKAPVIRANENLNVFRIISNQNWLEQHNERDQLAAGELIKFFCGSHSLIPFAEAASSSLAELYHL